MHEHPKDALEFTPDFSFDVEPLHLRKQTKSPRLQDFLFGVAILSPSAVFPDRFRLLISAPARLMSHDIVFRVDKSHILMWGGKHFPEKKRSGFIFCYCYKRIFFPFGRRFFFPRSPQLLLAFDRYSF
uniref:Uncharacterized protein n=1 Tax=Cacopsylla melanoneura TaxID=428564 RepID=A0A8D8ZSX5_9HEMI